MSTFKDALGREWSFSITVIEVKRLRELIQVDLLDFASEKADQMFNRLATDPVLLVDLMSILLTDQIQQLGLDERGFALGLVGEGLDNAMGALIREVANFSGPHRGKLILAAWNQVTTGLKAATAIAEKRLAEMDVEAMATKRFDAAFAQAQERFGS